MDSFSKNFLLLSSFGALFFMYSESFNTLSKMGPLSKFFEEGLFSSFGLILKSFSQNTGVVFFVLIILNLLGLYPCTFGLTTFFPLVMSFSILLWFSGFISSLNLKFKKFFAHLTPLGTPLLLGFFISIIEVVSKLMRPLTLSLRLCMKISTGHILLSLLASSGNLVLLEGLFMGSVILVLTSFYLLFEVFVSMMQASVYSLLLSSYLNEHVI